MDSAFEQMAVVAVSLLAGAVLAWLVVSVGGASLRAVRREVTRARGADRPEWAPGIWHCAACLTTNRPTATRCEKCHRPRQELVHEPVEPRPDWIPDRIVASPGLLVTLIHDPAAHTDPGLAHWRLTSGGRTVGTAQSRDGALALLRALDGTDAVALDVRGTGPATYRLAEVIARFEAPRFPLDVDCPERSSRLVR